jgi:hypothetical protein
MAYDVFISYSTKDLKLVDQFRKKLDCIKNVKVFIAEYSTEPGDPLNQKIISAIKNCDLFVLLWSRNSDASDYVRQEIGIASALEKQIIPVLLDKKASLPAFVRGIKYLAAYDGMDNALNWIQENVKTRSIKYQRNIAFVVIVTLVIAIVWIVSKKK